MRCACSTSRQTKRPRASGTGARFAVAAFSGVGAATTATARRHFRPEPPSARRGAATEINLWRSSRRSDVSGKQARALACQHAEPLPHLLRGPRQQSRDLFHRTTLFDVGRQVDIVLHRPFAKFVSFIFHAWPPAVFDNGSFRDNANQTAGVHLQALTNRVRLRVPYHSGLEPFKVSPR